MDRRKKRKELQQLGTFRSLMPDFPDGVETISEKPDFVINSRQGTVGIEITSLFIEPALSKKPLQAQETERQLLLSQASKLYDSTGKPKLHVSFHFANETPFNKGNRSQFARIICNLVAANIPTEGETLRLENDFKSGELFPFEINSLLVYRNQLLSSTFFAMPVVGWIQEDFTSTLQKAIEEKDKLLPKYKKCSAHWLLIVAEWSAPSSFFNPSEQTLKSRYQSAFDRVFFLNMFDRKLSQLTLVRVRANQSLKLTEQNGA